MTRRYGRARRGQRVHDAAPKDWERNVTVLGALSCSGLEAVMTATDAGVFLAYVTPVLAPTLQPGDVVVMDNLSAYQMAGMRSAIEAKAAVLVYLPPYSLDCSPIERCWSKLKMYLRAAKARTRNALGEALSHAIATVTGADAKGWFAHCDYAFY